MTLMILYIFLLAVIVLVFMRVLVWISFFMLDANDITNSFLNNNRWVLILILIGVAILCIYAGVKSFNDRKEWKEREERWRLKMERRAKEKEEAQMAAKNNGNNRPTA